MEEHPILFTREMVRAIIRGNKTQTRRVIKLPSSNYNFLGWCTSTTGDKKQIGRAIFENMDTKESVYLKCPYGQFGDHLWVRETWAVYPGLQTQQPTLFYKENGDDCAYMDMRNLKWKPSIFMPRWAARLHLEIKKVSVGLLKDISINDCLAEGMTPLRQMYIFGMNSEMIKRSYQLSYSMIWDSLYKNNSWDSNPYIWVIEFKRL
jgi:hypothetical protein